MKKYTFKARVSAACFCYNKQGTWQQHRRIKTKVTYVHRRRAESRNHHEFHAICPVPGTLLPVPVRYLLDCPRCLVISGVIESSSRAKSTGRQAKGGEGLGSTGAPEAATICAPLERSISPFRGLAQISPARSIPQQRALETKSLARKLPPPG